MKIVLIFLGSIVILFGIIFTIGWITPDCVERESYYYTFDWGNKYYLGTEFDKAVKMAKDRPISEGSRCVKYE